MELQSMTMVGKFLKKIKNRITKQSCNSTSVCMPKTNENRGLRKYLHTHVHSAASTIAKRLKQPTDRWTGQKHWHMRQQEWTSEILNPTQQVGTPKQKYDVTALTYGPESKPVHAREQQNRGSQGLENEGKMPDNSFKVSTWSHEMLVRDSGTGYMMPYMYKTPWNCS